MAEAIIFSAIAACSRNRVIGINNKLPWSIPEDLKFFREKTKGHIMIMGRKTFDSIGGKPLPGGRLHIVVTRQADYLYSHPDVKIVRTMDEAVNEAKKHVGKFPSEIFVVGGGEIYQQSLPYLDRVYLTMIETTVEGDSFFPELPTEKWKLVSERKVSASPSYSFEIWEPKV